MFASFSPTGFDLKALVFLAAAATVVVLIACCIYSSLRARGRGKSSAPVKSNDKAGSGIQSEDAAVPQPHDDVPPVPVTHDDRPAHFDEEAATLVDAANQWWQSNQRPLTIKVEGSTKLSVDGKGKGTIGGVQVEWSEDHEFAVSSIAELQFTGRVRVEGDGLFTVRIGKDGSAMLGRGGKVRIADNMEVVFEAGADLDVANVLSVSMSFDLGEARVKATGCQSVFGREGVQVMAARCGIVYASNGNVFAYRCQKVHATHDAVVYAVRCEEVSATERSRVCHHQCGKVSKRDQAVLEQQLS